MALGHGNLSEANMVYLSIKPDLARAMTILGTMPAFIGASCSDCRVNCPTNPQFNGRRQSLHLGKNKDPLCGRTWAKHPSFVSDFVETWIGFRPSELQLLEFLGNHLGDPVIAIPLFVGRHDVSGCVSSGTSQRRSARKNFRSAGELGTTLCSKPE